MPQTGAEFFLQPHNTDWHIPVLGIGSPRSQKTAWPPATPSGHNPRRLRKPEKRSLPSVHQPAAILLPEPSAYWPIRFHGEAQPATPRRRFRRVPYRPVPARRMLPLISLTALSEFNDVGAGISVFRHTDTSIMLRPFTGR